MRIIRCSTLILMTIAASAAAARAQAGGPDPADQGPGWLVTGASQQTIESDWVDILQGGIVGAIEGPSIQVVVLNKSDEDLRLEVRFRTPGRDPGCERTGDIAPGQSERFACRVESIRPRRTYPVHVRVATADGADRALDRLRVAWRFSKKDVAAIEESIAAARAARDAHAADQGGGR